MNTKSFGELLKRPEFLTFVVALVISIIAASGLAAKAGVPIPEKEIGMVVMVFWTIFIGAVFEGKFKKEDYAGGLGQLLNSTKFRLGLLMVIGVVVNALVKPFGYQIPDEVILSIGNFITLAIGGIAGLDGLQASQTSEGG